MRRFKAFMDGFNKLLAELKALPDVAGYEREQVDFAQRHFDAARALLNTAEGFEKEVLAAAHINATERAQVELEIGADALDAEPTARVYSQPVYDAKTGLYVLFGGDHFDY